eukprot:1141776-Pelagomonas_calceolata.AAC.2
MQSGLGHSTHTYTHTGTAHMQNFLYKGTGNSGSRGGGGVGVRSSCPLYYFCAHSGSEAGQGRTEYDTSALCNMIILAHKPLWSLQGRQL